MALDAVDAPPNFQQRQLSTRSRHGAKMPLLRCEAPGVGRRCRTLPGDEADQQTVGPRSAAAWDIYSSLPSLTIRSFTTRRRTEVGAELCRR